MLSGTQFTPDILLMKTLSFRISCTYSSIFSKNTSFSEHMFKTIVIFTFNKFVNKELKAGQVNLKRVKNRYHAKNGR